MKKNNIENKNSNENKKNNFIGDIKASFSGRKFKTGAYTTALSVVVIIIIIVVNLVVSKMNLQIDLSSQSMFTLTEDTKNLLKGLEDDITIYYVVSQGNETKEFENIAKLYDSASNKIALEDKDPVLYPNFASKYVEDEIAQNSFLVVNNTNQRAKYIPGADLLVQELNYQTYSMDTTGIDVEGELTSAISYVTTEDLPVMYVVDGHGETAAGDTFNSSLDKMNVEVQTLATATQTSIPEDCDILYINAPQTDFTEEEATIIKDYLAAGGKAIININYLDYECPNLLSILDYYGIELVKGMVFEGDLGMHMANYPHVMYPTIESHDITDLASDNQIPILMPYASGLLISDTTRSSLTVEPLLTTSDAAYSKVADSITVADKEEGDIDGPFYLGLVATDSYNDNTASLVVYSTEMTFSDDTSKYSNSDLLSGTVGYLVGDRTTISIPTKSLSESYISTTELEVILWGGFAAVVNPLLILISGGVICYRRRRK